MTAENFEALAVLLEDQRERLLARWREQVKGLPSARHLDTPTLTDHIPTFLEAVATGVRTPDLGGHAATSEFTGEVISRVRTKIDIWSSL